MFYEHPIFFEYNFVRRIYTGGKRIRHIEKPDFYPEKILRSDIAGYRGEHVCQQHYGHHCKGITKKIESK